MFLLQRAIKLRKFVRYAHTVDPQQEAALKEMCFLLDNDDKVIGRATKQECHEVVDDKIPPLHRAFSVFLFNQKGHLLLQKRSDEKITYPGHYSNTCCSHPIGDVPGEEEEKDAVGVKRAAQRRLNFELGIPTEQLPLEKFSYLTRIKYADIGNGQWGEHEIDYVLFFQDNVTVKPNSNEVSEISYVPLQDIDSFLPTLESPLTPWFKLILKYRLKMWWKSLDDLSKFKEHEKILTFKDK